MGTSAQSTSLRVTASTVSGREGKGAILIRPSEPVSSCLVMPRNAWRHSSVKVPSGPRKPIAFAKDTRGCISLDAGERWASPGQFRLFTCRPDGRVRTRAPGPALRSAAAHPLPLGYPIHSLGEAQAWATPGLQELRVPACILRCRPKEHLWCPQLPCPVSYTHLTLPTNREV